MTVKNAAGTDETVEKPLAPGRAAAAASRPVALSNEDFAVLDGIETLIGATNTALGTLGTQTTLAAMSAKLPAALGQTTMAGSVSVTIASDQTAFSVNAVQSGAWNINNIANPVTAIGSSIVATASVTRPADTTAYAIGDLVANSVTAGSVTPLSLAVARVNTGTGIIRRLRLTTTKTGLAGTEIFRVHLFQLTPTVTNGDNGAFSANGRAQGYIGFADITMSSVFNDGAFGSANVDLLFTAGAGVQTVFGLIEARTAYTPASGETFAVAVEALRD
jgi:hypothetical protein